MQALTLPARRGWRWLADGFAIFRRKQLMLSLAVLGYWMAMALISAFPFVGRFAAMLLIPVFSVSLMNACRVLESGAARPLAFAPPLLFSGFRKNSRTLLMLGVIYFLFTVGVFAAVALVDDGVLFRMVILGQPQQGHVLDSQAVQLAAQLALALFMPLMMAYWFAPVLVAWHDLPAAKSLFFSFIACLRNWRAFLVYGAAVVVVGALLPGVLTGVIGAVLPTGGGVLSIMLTALIVLFLLPTLYASFYVSYRDVFVSVDDNA
jgi:hypothetical protein